MKQVTLISAHENAPSPRTRVMAQMGCIRQRVLSSAWEKSSLNSDMERKKKALRQNHFHFTEKSTVAMKALLKDLLTHTGNIRLYFLCWVRIMPLDDYSRQVLPGLHGKYQEKLLKAKTENKTQVDDMMLYYN